MKIQKILMCLGWSILPGLAVAQNSQSPFFDDFNGAQLDLSHWAIMNKAWGRDNGGVVPDNVVVSNGLLHLMAHGDEYTGPVHGVDKKGRRISRVTRVGAAIVTRNYYDSGRFEARIKLPPHLGSCSAIWTYHYEEAYPGDAVYADLSKVGGVRINDFQKIRLTADQADDLIADLAGTNAGRQAYLAPASNGIYHTTEAFRSLTGPEQMVLSNDFNLRLPIFTTLANAASLDPVEGGFIRNEEIDIETPTALKTPSEISYRHARFNNWVGANAGEYTDKFDDLGKAFNDGQFHTFRFDWHTGNSNLGSQRVEYYIDGVCYQTNYTHVPTIGGQFTLGVWFPVWTGKPDFDTQEMDVDWVRITPFNENGDQWSPETQ
jgi:beta-glucanase (GH16 family)